MLEDYYCIFLIKRKKENPDLPKSSICVFQDCLRLNDILQRSATFKHMAELENARVYVSSSPKDMIKARKHLCLRLTTCLDEVNTIPNLPAQLFSSIMQCPIKEKKRFVVDADTTESFEIAQHILSENDIFFDVVHTPNGYHLIAFPFDVRLLEGVDVEVKRDGLTDINYVLQLHTSKVSL